MLGAVLGPFGGRLGAIFGRSCGYLGPSPGRLWAILGYFGAMYKPLEAVWAILKHEKTRVFGCFFF